MIFAPPPVPVQVLDDVFAPLTVTVKKGREVKWKWNGDGKHNVAVAEGPATFRSKSKRTGTFTQKVTKAGTYKILCTIHAPDMQMTLTVKR